MDITPPRLRRAYFECRHGQLHVHNAIPVGGGFDELTTLICLHGATGTGRMFLEVSRQLGSSRSIYSPDLPGCGESDASPTALSVAAYACAIADFL
ncbi:MAG TPA: alpha/beta fold hydrolase, partial [Steroidobacteraceae bacterium]